MQQIQLKDAKAKLSSLVDISMQGETTVITRHGKPEAVLMGYDEWVKLNSVPSFAKLLMFAPLDINDLPERDKLDLRVFEH